MTHSEAEEPGGNDCSPAFVPTVNVHDSGLLANHNMPCSVMNGTYKDHEPAVLDLNTGVFHPSWRAQRDGWLLLKVTKRWQRFICRLIGIID